jgi:hypothetical protein
MSEFYNASETSWIKVMDPQKFKSFLARFEDSVLFDEEEDRFYLWASDGSWPECDYETGDEIDFFSLVRDHMIPGSHILIYGVGFEQRWGCNCNGVSMWVEALHQDGRRIWLERDKTMAERIKNAGW